MLKSGSITCYRGRVVKKKAEHTFAHMLQFIGLHENITSTVQPA